MRYLGCSFVQKWLESEKGSACWTDEIKNVIERTRRAFGEVVV